MQPPPDHPAPDAPDGPVRAEAHGLGDDAVVLGPPALAIVAAPRALTDAAGWLVRRVVLDPRLEGPPGVLQGGLAATLPLVVARAADPLGAPLTRLVARLVRPTPLGVPLTVRLRSTAAATFAVVVEHEGDALVEAEVELAGADALAGTGDLVELAALGSGAVLGAGAGPRTDRAAGLGAEPHPTCVVCGSLARGPAALSLAADEVAPGAVAVGWVPPERVAGETAALPLGAAVGPPGVVDDLVLGAVLDCAAARATLPAARAGGATFVALGTFVLGLARPVGVLDPVRVVARTDGVEGRRLRARAAIVDDDGVVAATASVVNVALARLPSAERR